MSAEPLVDRMWSTGSYEEMAPNYLSMAAKLVERAGVAPTDAVLDVGCGTGNVAITAARRGARATGVDVTPSMLDLARENERTADADGVDWREADATDLPFEADAFDATLSSLGHMYADPPGTTTRELVRVTAPGGTLGFTAWTPTSLFPEMAAVAMTYLPPAARPEFTDPPFAWGDPDVVRTRLGDDVEDVAFETETATYPALSPEHFWREMAANSGAFVETVAAIDEEDRRALRQQMIETIAPHFDDEENAVELTYLLTTGTVA